MKGKSGNAQRPEKKNLARFYFLCCKVRVSQIILDCGFCGIIYEHNYLDSCLKANANLLTNWRVEDSAN